MKNAYFIIVLLVFFLIAGCKTKNNTASNGSQPKPKVSDRVKQIENSDKIVWLNYDEAVKLSNYKPKKIFIDVYTDWCGWCKRMEATTFRNSEITRYMNEKYYAVKLNAESGKKLTYKDQELTEAQLAGNVFHATGYPTTVYLTESQDLLQPVPGYLDVDMLNKILHFYGDNYYKDTPWEKFKLSYNNSEK